MPSPIAHGVVGFAIGNLLFPASGTALVLRQWQVRWVAVLAAALALMPDLGSALGVVTGDFASYHNSWEHSLVVGFIVALAGGGVVWWRQRDAALRWFAVLLLCFESHVLMDFLTWGRGVKLFWPISDERYQPPFYLFYGLHWSDGWWSYRHWITLFTELAFVGLMLLMFWSWQKRLDSTTSNLIGTNLLQRVEVTEETDRQ